MLPHYGPHGRNKNPALVFASSRVHAYRISIENRYKIIDVRDMSLSH